MNAPHVLQLLGQFYGLPARLPRQDPIDELVATILSQHTSDMNTERAFTSLRQRFPDWECVMNAPTSEVVDAIRMGGLANVKARRIQAVLQEVHVRLGGFDLSFLALESRETARAWLTSLPGVGPKTASCVLLFSLNIPAMPVDTHVHRVALRTNIIPNRTNATNAQELLEASIAPSSLYDGHMLLIQHGRSTCTARSPACERCILAEWCPSARRDNHPY